MGGDENDLSGGRNMGQQVKAVFWRHRDVE